MTRQKKERKRIESTPLRTSSTTGNDVIFVSNYVPHQQRRPTVAHLHRVGKKWTKFRVVGETRKTLKLHRHTIELQTTVAFNHRQSGA